jgi:hypothetical protein
MIIFKKKTVVLDCFTTESGIAEIFPITPLINNIPEWWKLCPNTAPAFNYPIDLSTIKRCPGIKDLFKTALSIPAWSEYILYKNSNQGFSHLGPTRLAEGVQHQSDQLGPMYENYFHFKFVSPWYFKENTGIKWLMIGPSWHQHSDLFVPPGLLEFKTQHSTHINIVSKKEENNIEYRIKAGDPLAYLVPLTDMPISIKTHVISQEEMKKMKTFHHSFYNSYEITKRILNEQARRFFS